MSDSFPYQARSISRFQAQDGHFTLDANQLVTVIAPTQNVMEWLDVKDDQGIIGSVPAGFLIPIEPATRQQTHPHQSPANHPPVSQDQTAQDAPVSLDNLPAPPSRSTSSASIEKPSTAAAIEKRSIAGSNTSDLPTFSPSSPSPPTTQAPPITPVTSHVLPSSQIPLEPLTPSKDTPPPASKPNALRDRIAMFNKAGPAPASPPPNTRPKPSIARKPMNFPAPAQPIEASSEPRALPSSSQDSETARSTAQPGMSAADAEESVKASGSLKDRIRLLQQQQQAAPSEAPSTPPKPKREWKRPPPMPTDESAVQIPVGILPSVRPEVASEGESSDRVAPEPVPSSAVDENADAVAEEEEEELLRRRKIAERMAKLGGAKMGFGFPGPVLGPKPTTVSPKQSTDAEPSVHPPAKESTQDEASSTLAPDRIAMPSIPKRAPPPRRKAPSPANVPVLSDASPATGSHEAITPLIDQAPPALDDSSMQASNDEALSVPHVPDVSSSVNVSPNPDPPLDDGAQSDSPTDQGQHPLGDSIAQESSNDASPVPSLQNSPLPFGISLPSDELCDDAAASNDQSSLSTGDLITQAINQDESLEALSIDPTSNVAVDASLNDYLNDQSSPPREPVLNSAFEEPGSQESKESPVEIVEEEDESARRQRIAERLAKLGGAKIGFGFPGGPALMAPKSAGSSYQQSSTSEQFTTSQSPREPSAAEGLPASSPSEKPTVITPATPPTRKAPSPAIMVPVTDQSIPIEDGLQLGSPNHEVSSPYENSTSDQVNHGDSPPAPPRRPAPVVVAHSPISSEHDEPLSNLENDQLVHEIPSNAA